WTGSQEREGRGTGGAGRVTASLPGWPGLSGCCAWPWPREQDR
ncbi:MAG: hypothetical protein AVDCRST_MAG22-304, partial [uncultured Rubrobacteraceae bacterium]